MKLKIIICIASSALILISALMPLPLARAEKIEYAMVAGSDVYIYATDDFSDSAKLFALPKTYFVKIIEEFDAYYLCDYQSSDALGYRPISGYVKKSGLLKKNPITPPYFLSQKITKKDYSELRRKPTSDSEILTVIVTDEVLYYGSYVSGPETYAYVKAAGRVGYVKISEYQPFEVKNHPDYVEPTPTPDPSEEIPNPPHGGGSTSVDNTRDTSLEIVMILLICIPAIIIVVLMFSKNNKRASKFIDYYHRDKYPPYDKENYYDK